VRTGISKQLLARPDRKAPFTLFLVHIEPGEALATSSIRHDGEEAGS